MKLKYKFENITLDNQITAVPVDTDGQFHGVLRINQTGAFLMDLLKEETTAEKLVADTLARYSGDETKIRSYVLSFVENLRNNGLLIEE